MVSQYSKDPTKVRAGRAGAQRRWGEGPSRVIRLDALDSEQRALVHAFVRMAEAVAAKTEKAAAESQHPATAGSEVRRGSVEHPAS